MFHLIPQVWNIKAGENQQNMMTLTPIIQKKKKV